MKPGTLWTNLSGVIHPLRCVPALIVGAVAAGCGAESWAPPAPAGTTWQYEHQGFSEHRTNVVAGAFQAGPVGLAYGGAFAFRNDSELHGAATADPFAESTPIDGIAFNEHLAGQGRKLLAGVLPPAPPSASAAPPQPAPASLAPSPPGALP